MEIVNPYCSGVDVHKQSLTACVITPNHRGVRTFGTMTQDLIDLADWLTEMKCSHVAMESTGVYWKPVFNILEAAGFQVLVVNAQHIKAVPGRKTDVKDSEWIADLLRHGLLRGSFIPDREQRELRELVRYRRQLIEEQSREMNRVQKVLEGANIKIGSVVTDVLGKTGRAVIEALIQGESSPEEMAGLARGSLKKKKELLQKALHGLVGHHQRMLLETQLRHIDFLETEVDRLSKEIEARMRPFDEAIARLDVIPGISRRTAEQILAEIGLDMRRFPSAKHLASWAGLCPGNNESAGKRKSGKVRNGNSALKATLAQTAKVISRTKDNYLSSMYHRFAARKGSNKATIAVAHALIVIIYHMLKDNMPFQDLGVNHYDEANRQATVRRAVNRLECLGFKVTVEPISPAA